jgi:hypothetical protein
MGWIPLNGRLPLKEALHVLEHFSRRARQVNNSSQFAAIRYPMGKPTGELLHFSHGVG